MLLQQARDRGSGREDVDAEAVRLRVRGPVFRRNTRICDGVCAEDLMMLQQYVPKLMHERKAYPRFLSALIVVNTPHAPEEGLVTCADERATYARTEAVAADRPRIRRGAFIRLF